jgi:hypothetical protein
MYDIDTYVNNTASNEADIPCTGTEIKLINLEDRSRKLEEICINHVHSLCVHQKSILHVISSDTTTNL